MRSILTLLIILFFAFNAIPSYSQTKKAPVKKAAAVSKIQTSVKANTSVVKAKLPVQNKSITAKITPPVKTISKPVVTPAVQSKPVTEVISPTLTGREQEMINEINNLRLNPAKYCTYVEAYLQKNDVDADVKVAAKELMTLLKKMPPLNPLTINSVMYNDARQYGLLMAKKNVFEHSSLPYAENLSLGYKDIRDAIVDLLIDDDNPERGHRKNLLSEKIKQVAVFELPGKVQDIGYCYVQEFK